MSGGQWKPGDVAMVTIDRKDRGQPTQYVAFNVGDGYGWHGVANGQGFGRLTDNEKTFAITRRPLVVIDPENALDVERMVDAWYDAGALDLGRHDQMQAALRSLIAPPKLDEPQNFLAAVEDRNGSVWVRQADGCWRSLTSRGQFVVAKDWNDKCTPLAQSAVRVLSEGVVTP